MHVKNTLIRSSRGNITSSIVVRYSNKNCKLRNCHLNLIAQKAKSEKNVRKCFLIVMENVYATAIEFNINDTCF